MRSLKEKNRWGEFLQSKPVLGVLMMVFFISAWSLLGFWGKMSDTNKNKQLAQEKLQDLQQSKSKLESDISKLETERGVEEVLRENFGLAREGEGLIVVVEEKEGDNQVDTKKGGFFGFFRNLFR